MEWRECRGGDFFFVMRRRPPRSTLVPYTTLFRSVDADAQGTAAADLARPRLQPGRRGSDDVDRLAADEDVDAVRLEDRKSTHLNSSHANISYAVFCLKKKKKHLPLHPHLPHSHYV